MKVLELPFPFETPDDGFVLPARDPYGVPHGDPYVPFNNAKSINLATRAEVGGVKVTRIHQACSLNELRAIVDFSFNPYVIDIREQYPEYSQEAYNQARIAGKRMSRSSVMTYDIVLTLILHPGSRHYHGVSIKDATHEPTPRAEKRKERERERFAARGWTWELLKGDQFSQRAYGNYMLMRSWIGGIDIWSHRGEAREFAFRLRNHSLEGTLEAVVARNARYMGISRDRAFMLFAVAVSFGHLAVDHSEDLRVDRPLKLRDWRTS
jgi:hypothetical protein